MTLVNPVVRIKAAAVCFPTGILGCRGLLRTIFICIPAVGGNASIVGTKYLCDRDDTRI